MALSATFDLLAPLVWMVDRLEAVATHVVASEVFEAVWPPIPPPLLPAALLLLILARTLVEAEAPPLSSLPTPPPFSPFNRPLLRERSKVIPDGLVLPIGSEPELLGDAGAKLEVEQVLDRDALRLRAGVRCPVSAGPTFLINPDLGGFKRLSIEDFLFLGDNSIFLFKRFFHQFFPGNQRFICTYGYTRMRGFVNHFCTSCAK